MSVSEARNGLFLPAFLLQPPFLKLGNTEASLGLFLDSVLGFLGRRAEEECCTYVTGKIGMFHRRHKKKRNVAHTNRVSGELIIEKPLLQNGNIHLASAATVIERGRNICLTGVGVTWMS